MQHKKDDLMKSANNKQEDNPNQRKATIAYEAEQKIESVLNDEQVYLYKPWQLKKHLPQAITYKTTYDEIFLIAKEKAMFRPFYKVTNNYVTIPVLFSKINGISSNRKSYWNELHSLILLKNSLLIKQFPFQPFINRDFRFHYRNMLNEKGSLDEKRLLNSRIWKYSHLSIGLQKGIASAIKTICQTPKLKKINKETNEDVKMFLFTQAMQIPTSILKLLQTFDFSDDVPKLILYHNNLSGQFARTDASLLLLLNELGVDIVVYNPAGHRDIEKFIDDSLFDTHLLDDVVLELPWKSPSLLKRLLSGRLFK